VAGVPDLLHRATVQMDRNIALPLVGMLPVAGQPLPQIRAKIGAALASEVLRQRTADGREAATVVGTSSASITMTGYRPIYMNGDVSKPGEYPYRPATTTRQRVAVADGTKSCVSE
jgi:polysaccharide export outer membrane protein